MPRMKNQTTAFPSGRRIQLVRAFTKAAVASRTQARQYILDGRVTVNGDVVKHILHWVDVDRDDIRFDGKSIKPIEQKTYIVVHKPAGYLTTRSDSENRPTVYDLLPAFETWLFPVGRLDMDSEGLLLLTNDGALGNWLKEPEHDISKRYKVLLDRPMLEKQRKQLEQGIFLKTFTTKPCRIRRIGPEPEGYWMSIILTEGKNRQVRRMMEVVGYSVKRLIRTHIGPLALNDLPAGQWRTLSSQEIADLKEMRRNFLKNNHPHETL